MKVVENTATYLIIEDRPWLTGVMLVAMLLAFVGGGVFQLLEGHISGAIALIGIGGGLSVLFLFLFVRRTRFTFDRSRGALTRTVRSLSGLTETEVLLTRIERAIVEESVDSDGTTYRVSLALRDPGEAMSFTNYYSGGRASHMRIAETINAWIGARP